MGVSIHLGNICIKVKFLPCLLRGIHNSREFILSSIMTVSAGNASGYFSNKTRSFNKPLTNDHRKIEVTTQSLNYLQSLSKNPEALYNDLINAANSAMQRALQEVMRDELTPNASKGMSHSGAEYLVYLQIYLSSMNWQPFSAQDRDRMTDISRDLKVYVNTLKFLTKDKNLNVDLLLEKLNTVLEDFRHLLDKSSPSTRLLPKRGEEKNARNTENVTFDSDGKIVALSEAAILEKLLDIEELQDERNRAISGKVWELRRTLYTWFRCWWRPDQLASILDSQYQRSDRQQSIIYLIEVWVFKLWMVKYDSSAIPILKQLMDRVDGDEDRRKIARKIKQELMVLPRTHDYISIRRCRRRVKTQKHNEATSVWKSVLLSVSLISIRESDPVLGRFRLSQMTQQLTIRQLSLFLSITPREIALAIFGPHKLGGIPQSLNGVGEKGLIEEKIKKLQAIQDFNNTLYCCSIRLVLKEHQSGTRKKVYKFLTQLANVVHLPFET